MPKLPTYTASLEGGAVSGGRRAEAEDGIGKALVGMGRAVQGEADAYMAQREKDTKEAERLRKEQEADARRNAAIRGSAVVAKGRNDFLTYLNEADKTPQADMPNVVSSFNQAFDDFKNKALENENHPEGRQLLDTDLENLRAGLVDNAMRMQAGRAGRAAADSVKGVFQENMIAVQKAPEQLGAMLAQQEELIARLDFPGLTDAQRQKLKEDQRYLLGGAAIGSIVAGASTSAQARAIKADLEKNPLWQQRLTGQQYAHAMNALTTDIKQYEKSERAEYRAQLAERVAERAAGVANGLTAREAGGDPKLAAAIANAEAMGNARTAIKSVPFTDMVAMVRDAEAKLMTPGGFKGDAAYLQAVQAAAAERMRAIKEDPAGYTIQNSNPAKKAFDAMSDSNFSPESVRRYAAVAAGAQRDLGGPIHSVKLLPKQMTDQVVSEIASLPPEQAANRMESLQKQFGPLWTEVLGEMRGKVPAGVSTLGRLTSVEDSRVRVDLASAIKDKDLRKNLLDTDAKEVDARVDEGLQPYARVVSQAGSGAQMMLSEELAAAKALSYKYVSQGASPSAAAKKAVNDLIFNRYDVGDTFLAPKGVLSLAQRQAAKIMQETPADQFPEAAGGDPSVSSKYRRDANRAAADLGYWANVTDLSSGKLGIEWRYGDGTPVLLQGGEKVRLLFDELKNLPTAPRKGALPRDFTQTPGGATTR